VFPPWARFATTWKQLAASAASVCRRESHPELTPECEVMGDHVGGIAVPTGARVMAPAEPGRVLVMGTVKDLVAGSGIKFSDMYLMPHGKHLRMG
jgi:hypothetical protein